MKPEPIRTTTTIKPRTGLAQTLLAAAALLGMSLLLILASGCGRDERDEIAAAEQTLEERERAVALAERELTLAEREAAITERAARQPAPRARVYAEHSTSVPQVVEIFDPIAPTARRSYSRQSLSLPAGTTLDVELVDSLSSATAHAGMPFEARVAQDVYSGAELVIPAGAEISGTVVEAIGLRRVVGGRAKLALEFDRVELASGRSAAIDASFERLGRRETARDAATIGGAAAAGAVLGNQVNTRHRDRAKVIGAILGAGVGTAIAHRTNGEVVLQAGTAIAVRLEAPILIGDRA